MEKSKQTFAFVEMTIQNADDQKNFLKTFELGTHVWKMGANLYLNPLHFVMYQQVSSAQFYAAQ